MQIEPERELTEAEVAAERRRALVASLERERDGYRTRGLDKRAAQVEEELKRLTKGEGDAGEARQPTTPTETAVEAKPRQTATRGRKG
ncbi:hypothetical protein ACFWFS_00310 [Streptomyces albidoflavus]|uniref:hypothetical protein n=1 Tax=Streptomyces albidoflavus TaxID=1886 RepID=UPI0033C6FACD